MSDMGDYWRDMHEHSKQRRAANRDRSAIILRDSGVRFDTRNGGAHLIVHGPKAVYDFWPGTGLWQQRGASRAWRGVRSLVREVTGREPVIYSS